MKRFYQILQMSRNIDCVKEFINKMREIGATGGPDYDSYIYEKDNYILVAAYRPLDDKLVGSIMTKEVYKNLKEDAKGKFYDLALAYFAWTYGYGYNLLKDHHDPADIMMDIEKFPHVKEEAQHMGDYYPALYVVTMCEDIKEERACGVSDEYYILGISDDVRQAEYMVERTMAEKPLNKNRKYTISPVKINTIIKPEERPAIGLTSYIE